MFHVQSKVVHQVKSPVLCPNFRRFFHFIYFNGFLTTRGEGFCSPSSIRRVFKGEIVDFVKKVSNFAQTFFNISRFNLEVVSTILTPFLTHLVQRDQKINLIKWPSLWYHLKDNLILSIFHQHSVPKKNSFTIYGLYCFASRRLCETANTVILNFSDNYILRNNFICYLCVMAYYLCLYNL